LAGDPVDRHQREGEGERHRRDPQQLEDVALARARAAHVFSTPETMKAMYTPTAIAATMSAVRRARRREAASCSPSWRDGWSRLADIGLGCAIKLRAGVVVVQVLEVAVGQVARADHRRGAE